MSAHSILNGNPIHFSESQGSWIDCRTGKPAESKKQQKITKAIWEKGLKEYPKDGM